MLDVGGRQAATLGVFATWVVWAIGANLSPGGATSKHDRRSIALSRFVEQSTNNCYCTARLRLLLNGGWTLVLRGTTDFAPR